MGDRKGKSTDFLKKTQTFLTFLLVLLWTDWFCFCLVASVSLTVSLAMGGVKSTKKKIAIGLVEFSQ